jgi:hypothetical protein
MLLGFLPNIRLGRKGLQMTNTPAYFALSSMTEKKFYVIDFRASVKKGEKVL